MEDCSCPKCGHVGHVPGDCSERRFKKIWPGQYVFRGKIRTPDGGTVEMEMPMGEHGARLLMELVNLCASGGERVTLPTKP